MLNTTNLNLNKPELTDVPDITALNQNWDTLDEIIRSLMEGKVAIVDGKGLSTNDFTSAYKTILDNATNLNTVNTVVKRDASGNFTANTITANTFNGNLSGNASSANSLYSTFTFSLLGQIQGEVELNGSENVIIYTSEGNETTRTGSFAHAEGQYTQATGTASHAEGMYTTAETYSLHSQGQYNKVNSGSSMSYSATQNAFVIGNGISSSAKSNAFRVTFSGATYGLSAFNSTGADYAEYFEWEDGNVYGEDRVGKFVALSGDKIKIANSTDYILGVVSGNASIIGNAHDDVWKDMYARDDFGRFIYEDVIVTNEFDEEVVEHRIKLNSDFDSSQEYEARSERVEWSTIGMLGQLVVFDDGGCKVNGYCTCNDEGIATDSESGYRVIKRINENIISIIFK